MEAGQPLAAGWRRVPGLRTFQSARFRTVLAATLAGCGSLVLASILAGQAAKPLETGQYGVDFFAYLVAARRMLEGLSPYPPQLLSGPIPAQTIGQYLYPPPLAQALAPFAGLPFGSLATAWLLLQAAAVVAAVWLGGSVGGLAPTGERLLWTVAACVFFLPVLDTLWKGNVSGFIALAAALVAVGGGRAGFAAGASALLKVSPAAFIPALERRSVLGLALAVGLGGLSVLVAPVAWRDYAIVLPNLMAGSADNATNLSPHVQLPAALPVLAGAASAIRAAELVVTVLLLAGAARLARRGGGLPAATVAASGALLLGPAASWLHYLVVLLPLAATAWGPARPVERAGMAVGAGLVSASLAALPLALAGAALMWALALRGTLRLRRGSLARADGC